MTLKEILELIDKVAGSGISTLEIERGGFRLKIDGKRSESATIASPAAVHDVASPAGTGEAMAAPAGGEQPAAGDETENWHIITSPIVGTFFRAPNPESEAFVNLGSKVQKGGVLCIIEAMKLMNEIESDVDGVITKIYPQNGQPVEYGEKLFAVQI